MIINTSLLVELSFSTPAGIGWFLYPDQLVALVCVCKELQVALHICNLPEVQQNISLLWKLLISKGEAKI